MQKVVLETNLPLPLLKRGKVRDVYELPESRLLLVATDRISAFDKVMREGIPEKGRVLTGLSKFWFEFISSRLNIPTHFLGDDPDSVGLDPKIIEENDLPGRIMIVRKTMPIPLEWIVSGYLYGSLWKEYQAGNWMSSAWKGLSLAAKLPKPVIRFTTKASEGHDKPLSYEQARDLFAKWAQEEGIKTVVNPYYFFGDLVLKSLEIYNKASEYAEARGIIIADTKLEFGFAISGITRNGDPEPVEGSLGQVMLIDEALTPDSSRFWLKDQWKPGQKPESRDKQILRDWLEGRNWDKESDPPSLPQELIGKLSDAYQKAEQLLT